MKATKYSKEALARAAAVSVSIAGVLSHLGLRANGGSHSHISRRLKEFGIDTSHFTGQGHNRGKTSYNKRPINEILVATAPTGGRTKPAMLRRAMLFIGLPECCEICGLGPTWFGRPLRLHVDHINGDFLDNQPHNLRFLCPNCHSQTATYRNRTRSSAPAEDVVYDAEATTPTGVKLGRRLPEPPQWTWRIRFKTSE
jgi:hypothetical protein